MQSTQENREHTALSNRARCEMCIMYLSINSACKSFLRKATRFHAKGTCNEMPKMPKVVLGPQSLRIIYLRLGKWHSPDSTFHSWRHMIWEESPKYQRLSGPFPLLFLHPYNYQLYYHPQVRVQDEAKHSDSRLNQVATLLRVKPTGSIPEISQSRSSPLFPMLRWATDIYWAGFVIFNLICFQHHKMDCRMFVLYWTIVGEHVWIPLYRSGSSGMCHSQLSGAEDPNLFTDAHLAASAGHLDISHLA